MSYEELLGGVELFRKLPEQWRSLVTDLVQEEMYDEEEIIFRAGEPSDCTYVVRRGKVALYTDTVGEPVELKAELERGGVFGELGVLEGSSRSLSARATEATSLLRLEGDELLRLAKAHEAFAQELNQIAIGYAIANQAAQTELAQRKEARIRIDYPVELRVSSQEPLLVVLENLSLGGACFSGLSEGWQLDETALLAVGTDPTTSLFSVNARVLWRKEDTVGVCFTSTASDHELRISGAIHRLVKAARGGA